MRVERSTLRFRSGLLVANLVRALVALGITAHDLTAKKPNQRCQYSAPRQHRHDTGGHHFARAKVGWDEATRQRNAGHPANEQACAHVARRRKRRCGQHRQPRRRSRDQGGLTVCLLVAHPTAGDGSQTDGRKHCCCQYSHSFTFAADERRLKEYGAFATRLVLVVGVSRSAMHDPYSVRVPP